MSWLQKQLWQHVHINYPIRGHNPFLVNPSCDLQILPETIGQLQTIARWNTDHRDTIITSRPMGSLQISRRILQRAHTCVGRESGGGRCWTDSILLTLQSHTAEGTGRCAGCLCWSVCGELYFSSSDPYESDIERVLWSLRNRRIKHFTAGTLSLGLTNPQQAAAFKARPSNFTILFLTTL